MNWKVKHLTFGVKQFRCTSCASESTTATNINPGIHRGVKKPDKFKGFEKAIQRFSALPKLNDAYYKEVRQYSKLTHKRKVIPESFCSRKPNKHAKRKNSGVGEKRNGDKITPPLDSPMSCRNIQFEKDRLFKKGKSEVRVLAQRCKWTLGVQRLRKNPHQGKLPGKYENGRNNFRGAQFKFSGSKFRYRKSKSRTQKFGKR